MFKFKLKKKKRKLIADEDELWDYHYDCLKSILGKEYSQEDIGHAFGIAYDKFYEILEDLNK